MTESYSRNTTSSSNINQDKKKLECYGCGEPHNSYKCPHKNLFCEQCSKTGHIKQKCRTKILENQTEDVKTIWQPRTTCKGIGREHIIVKMFVEGIPIELEVDTGSSVTILSKDDFTKLKIPLPKLRKALVTVRSYTGHKLNILGEMVFKVKYDDQEYSLSTLVSEGVHGCSIIGRDWLSKIPLHWEDYFPAKVKQTKAKPEDSEDLISENSELFKEELDCFKQEKVHIELQENEQKPICQYSKWATQTQIVPIPKPNGSVRICAKIAAGKREFHFLKLDLKLEDQIQARPPAKPPDSGKNCKETQVPN